MRFDDVIIRIQNGYPKEQGFGELTEDPVPAFLTRPKVNSVAAVEQALAEVKQAAE
jgi:hypothetical protein